MAEPDARYCLPDAEAAFAAYRQGGDAELRNKLVMHYSYIAKSVAVQMRGITGGYAQVEDVVNEGILTLMDCLDKYTPEKGMKFENYAYMRVRNANIDFVRKQDWVPRRVRRAAREMSDAYNLLSTRLMREPTGRELAEHLGVSEETVAKNLADTSAGAVLSFEDMLAGALPGAVEAASIVGGGEAELPEQGLMQDELRGELIQAIEALTEKERLVVSLYYYEHLKLHEIAEIMGVTESRVSQTHSKAIMRMRSRLTAYMRADI